MDVNTNKKSTLNNSFIILYPLLLIIMQNVNLYFNDEIIKNNVNYFEFIVCNFIYFLILGLFVYFYYVKKVHFHVASLVVGILEIVAIQIIAILSIKEYLNIFSQLQLNIYIYNSLLALYIVLLISQLKCKNK